MLNWRVFASEGGSHHMGFTIVLSYGFTLKFALPQTELQTLGQNCERTLAQLLGPATIQNLVVKLDGEICGGVLVENASHDFPRQKKLENLLPNFAGSSPPISPKTSPTSLWKSLVPTILDGGNSALEIGS